MAGMDLITLIVIVTEVISIVITLIVIILELLTRKTIAEILQKMENYSKELDKHVSRQVEKIDGHTKKLESHVNDLDKHSHRMEDSLKRLLKENEEIYKKICQPFSEEEIKSLKNG